MIVDWMKAGCHGTEHARSTRTRRRRPAISAQVQECHHTPVGGSTGMAGDNLEQTTILI